MISPELLAKYHITTHEKGRLDITGDGFRLLVMDHTSRAGAERTTGISARTLRRWGELWPDIDWPKDSTRGDLREGQGAVDEFTVIGETAKLTRIVTERITTLDQLIKYANIDITIWDIERWSCNKWEVAAYNREAKEFKVQDLWQVKATLRRSKDKADLLAMRDEILDAIETKSPVVENTYEANKDGYLCEIDLFDFHLGKFSWAKETGINYDTKIAQQIIDKAVDELMARITPYPVAGFLVPVGNDYFNSNSSMQTTAAGTPQDEEGRWKKTFRIGFEVIMRLVEKLTQVAPVEIIGVPGNHDEDSVFYLMEVLRAYYKNNNSVTVDDDLKLRKYHVYGFNLIGFTHGSEEKIKDLPAIMATEMPKAWAATKVREWHLGHIHRKREYNWLSIEENQGVTVRMLRSLSATDEWHHRKGYVGNIRAAEAFIWAKAGGVVAQISVYV